MNTYQTLDNERRFRQHVSRLDLRVPESIQRLIILSSAKVHRNLYTSTTAIKTTNNLTFMIMFGITSYLRWGILVSPTLISSNAEITKIPRLIDVFIILSRRLSC